MGWKEAREAYIVSADDVEPLFAWCGGDLVVTGFKLLVATALVAVF